MKNNYIKLLDVVALIIDISEYNLYYGQVGTVVEILDDGKASEVEFSYRDGRTYEFGLTLNQIMLFYFEPVALNSTQTMTKV